MTYVVSDLHGNLEKFQKLLSQIGFTDDDVMYVVGDMVDCGEESIALLCDLSMRFNVLPIVGEHDYRALRLLTAMDRMLRDGGMPEPEILGEMTQWVSEGGQKTMEDFKALDEEMREGVLEYLSDMTLYEELTVNGRKYLLVHAGIDGFSPDTPLDEYMPEDFIGEPLDMEREYFEDVTVIVGHVPADSLPDADPGMIYYGEGSINIDCGLEFGGRLGCLCLDNGKEYYV